MKIFKDTSRRKTVFIGIAILGLAFVTSMAYVYTQVEVTEQSETFSTNATILNTNTNNSELTAGIATGHGMSFGKFNKKFNKTKTLNLSASDPTLVEIDVTGNISDRLKHPRLHLFENKTQIDIEMVGNQSGFYKGQINLEMVIAQNEWGEKWINLIYKYFS